MILNSEVSTFTENTENDTSIKPDAGIDVNINSESKASSTRVSWLDMMAGLLFLFIVSIILSSSFSWCHISSGNNRTMHHKPETEAPLSPVIAMYSSLPLQSSFTEACLQDKVGGCGILLYVPRLHSGLAGVPHPS